MRHWRPTTPKFTWFLVLLGAMANVLPFIVGLVVLLTDFGSASFQVTSLAPRLADATFYTFKQAAISAAIVAVCSPFFAVGLCLAPPRLQRLSAALSALAFCLPSLVIATGIVLAWGNNGSATRLLSHLGFSSPLPALLYSPYAVVFANTLMNLPFASLMVHKALLQIPGDQLDSVTLLGLKLRDRWRCLIIPSVLPTVAYFTGMTFLLSLGSFGALSILSGGPASQTLELGIYQSVYYDGNWQAAAVFAVAHSIVAGSVALIFLVPQYRWLNNYQPSAPQPPNTRSKLAILLGLNRPQRLLCVLATTLLDLFILMPILAILAEAGRAIFAPSSSQTPSAALFFASLGTSLTYALPTACIATGVAYAVTKAFCRYKEFARPRQALAILAASIASTMIPAMATAFGLLVIRSMSNDLNLSVGSIITLHSAMALPLLINILLPVYGRRIAPYNQHQTLCGIPATKWTATIEWPVFRRTLMLASAVALALSLNETAVVSMLGDPTTPALTTTMIQLMGHYRFGDAAIASCVLILVTSLCIWLLASAGGSADDAA